MSQRPAGRTGELGGSGSLKLLQPSTEDQDVSLSRGRTGTAAARGLVVGVQGGEPLGAALFQLWLVPAPGGLCQGPGRGEGLCNTEGTQPRSHVIRDATESRAPGCSRDGRKGWCLGWSPQLPTGSETWAADQGGCARELGLRTRGQSRLLGHTPSGGSLNRKR